MKRRDPITLLGGAAAGWPLAARAQQGERVRLIGVLLAAAADDAEVQARIAAFLQGLQRIGLDRSAETSRIDMRWALANAGRYSQARGKIGHACAPMSSWPTAHSAVGANAQATLNHRADRVRWWWAIRSAPEFVDSLARPGGNATGFMNFEYSMGGKWLPTLKQLAPGVGLSGPGMLRRNIHTHRDRPVRRHPDQAPTLEVEISTRSTYATRPKRSSALLRPSHTHRMAV